MEMPSNPLGVNGTLTGQCEKGSPPKKKGGVRVEVSACHNVALFHEVVSMQHEPQMAFLSLNGQMALFESDNSKSGLKLTDNRWINE